MRNVQRTLLIPEELDNKIVKLAKELDMSPNLTIRFIIDRYFKEHEEKKEVKEE